MTYDGSLRKWRFSSGKYGSDSWEVTATSYARAVRAFRVGAAFPASYCTKPDLESRVDLREVPIPGMSYRSSACTRALYGAEVIVHVLEDGSWVEAGRVPVEDPSFDSPSMPTLLRGLLGGDGSPASSETALVASSGLPSSSRRELEARAVEIAQRRAELDALRRKLSREAMAIRSEIERRMEQLWVIELFLGSEEQVVVLRHGEPAPADTLITLRQRVLCMDEEIATYDWIRNPSRVGAFDYKDIAGFDKWLVESPEHLDQVFPHPKGVVALRVRRWPKDRTLGAGATLLDAYGAIQEKIADEMTYLLVRNGDALYRLWIDVKIWPRLIPRFNEWGENPHHSAEDDAKRVVAGYVAIQGILERSELLHPLPETINIFNADHVDKYIEIVRDDENHLKLLSDGDPLTELTWPAYHKWLVGQLRVGMRASIHRSAAHYGYQDREWGLRANVIQASWNYEHPEQGAVHVLEAPSDMLDGDFTIMITRWVRDGHWDRVASTRRLRYGIHRDEAIPFDLVSWRVLEHLLLDRTKRQAIGSALGTLWHWWARWKAEAEKEAPFVDLVLRQAGAEDTTANRARVERLVRWWKMKTKANRNLSDDEPKALRMILKAYEKGQDFDNDPETLLFARQK
jgi:hypothetical protein